MSCRVRTSDKAEVHGQLIVRYWPPSTQLLPVKDWRNSMLPKERVIAALEFRRPDRIPVGETGVDYAITEQALGRPTLYRAKWKEYTALWEGRRDEYVESCKRDIVDLARCLEHDVVPAFLVPSRHKPARSRSSSALTSGACPTGACLPFRPRAKATSSCSLTPTLRVDDIQDIPLDFDESQLELVRHVVKEMGGTHFILGRPGDGIFPLMRYTLEYLLTA